MKNVDGLKYYLKKVLFDHLERADLPLTNYAVAGGAVRDFLAGDKIKDIDVFCQSAADEDALVNFFYQESNRPDPSVILLNQNDKLANYKVNGRWVQIIRGKYYDLDSDELIKSFDFTICCGMVRADGSFRATPTFFQDTLAKHLRINQITFPLSTLERLQKYVKRGYTACNGTLLAITQSLQKVDLKNPKEDTLRFYPDGTPRFTGVD